MLGFDTETTGPDPLEARLVSATCDLWLPGDTSPTTALRLVVNPGVPIPAEATAVHGIDDATARRVGITPDRAVSLLSGAITDAWADGVPVVAYNAAFDLTVLDREARRHRGIPVPVTGPVVDPFVIDKQIDRYRKGKRTLETTCAHYGVTLDNAHDATADATAAVLLARAVGARHGAALPGDLASLWKYQRQARREQAESLARYFRDSGKTEPDGSPIVVDPSWPIREEA